MDLKKYIKQEKEQPLDNIVSDGGFCSIFRKIVCVGDSLSSGEFEIHHDDKKITWHDMFEYSWGQFIAREAGVDVYNFSRGGMTTEEYCDSFADNKGFWNEDIKANAYIIALGVNDILQDIVFGDLSDIDKENFNNNKKTFVGYYAKIIQRYKTISPNAKFFLVTPPFIDGCKKEKFISLTNYLYEFIKIFEDCYVLDLQKFAPDYTDESFKENFFLYGHLSPAGYKLTAKMIMSYIDYIVRNNPKDFKLIAFNEKIKLEK